MKDEIVQKRKEKTQALADNMLSQINSGKSFQEIADSNGLNLGVAGNILREHFGKGYRQLREEAFNESLTRVKSGKLELFQVRDTFDLCPTTFYGKIQEKGIRHLFDSDREKDLSEERLKSLYKSLERNGDNELDALLRAGLPLVEIGDFLGMNDRYVEHYMFGSGQHHIWKKNHDEPISKVHKEKEDARKLRLLHSNIVGILIHSIAHLKPADSKKGYSVEEKTAQALALTELRAGRRRIEIHKPLQKVFQVYFEAQANGERMSISALSKSAGYKGVISAARPLHNIGLHSLFKEPHLTQEQEELIFRARKTPFSVPDIHYFLNIPSDRRCLEKRMVGRKNPSSFALVSGDTRISYSTASQVYQALEENVCKISELGELIPGMTEEKANLILDNRDNIESVIIAGLKKIYPRYKITTPYFFPGVKR